MLWQPRTWWPRALEARQAPTAIARSLERRPEAPGRRDSQAQLGQGGNTHAACEDRDQSLRQHNETVTSAGHGRSALILDRADNLRPELEAACVSIGLQPRHLADLMVGRPLAQLLNESLSHVNLVLLVIDNAPIPPSVMFEAGLAHGRGIPVAVLDGRGPKRPGTTDELALDTLLPGPRLYAHLSDRVGIAEQLDAYLQLQPPGTAPSEAVKPSGDASSRSRSATNPKVSGGLPKRWSGSARWSLLIVSAVGLCPTLSPASPSSSRR